MFPALPAHIRYFHEIGVLAFLAINFEGEREAFGGFWRKFSVVGIIRLLCTNFIIKNSHDFLIWALGAEEIKVVGVGRSFKPAVHD
ncbi:hypothetical protein VPH49_18850 [Pseudomonas luteola]|uniref:hypothetical protein n=1 Tax=Pseudomonas luteola TaxID=47886 RepID=UPI003A89240D